MELTRNESIQFLSFFYLNELTHEDRFDILIDVYSENNEFENIVNASSSAFNSDILNYIYHSFLGVTNEYIKDELGRFGIHNLSIFGEVELLNNCPCCLYRTLLTRGAYMICDLCKWEDDGIEEIESYSSCNHSNIKDYRAIILCNDPKLYKSNKFNR